eukprot:jgi/Tetstr1/446622/TSEL_034146.t1
MQPARTARPRLCRAGALPSAPLPARPLHYPSPPRDASTRLPFPVSVPDDYPPACAAEGGHIRVLDWMWLMKHADISDAIHCGLRASSPVPLEFRWVLGYLRLQQGKAMCCGVVAMVWAEALESYAEQYGKNSAFWKEVRLGKVKR